MKIRVVEGRFAVARLEPADPLPPWPAGPLVSMTRTGDELSIICEESAVPSGVRAERGWRCFRVAGPIAFETTGVAASVTAPLAEAQISVFLIATYDTDYFLVKDEVFEAAVRALRDAGHEVNV